jgi:K+-transporting ATPase A subunit
MKQVLSAAVTAGTMFVLPFVSSAASLADGSGEAGAVGNFLGNFLGFIDKVLLPLILGLAFLMFVWGVFKFFILGGSDEEAQQKGKSLMLYAVAGFVLILSFYGIVSVLTNGLGFGGESVDAPRVPTTI